MEMFYDEGAAAAKSGKKESSCPYVYSYTGSKRAQWMQGYLSNVVSAEVTAPYANRWYKFMEAQ